MKLLSRDFTKREIVLMIVLFLLLLVLLYYRFVQMVVVDGISRAQTEKEALETDVVFLRARLSELQGMQTDVGNMEKSGEQLSYMPSYNASKEEFGILNRVLADTISYSIRFDEVSREENQIRRSFSLNFVEKSYMDGMTVLENLENSEVRCLIGDVSCSIQSADEGEGRANISANVTFYETMYGGTEDGELPEGSENTENTEGVE